MSENGFAVEIEAMERRFGDLVAVNRISFGVPRGEVFGFVGPNGAGKTTTMRILATLDMPTSGDARVAGKSVVDDPDSVRHLLGFMPDSLGVYSNMTVYEYLDFFARSYRLRGEARRAAVRTVMDFADLGPLQNKGCETLSKGMKQRLGLARTLIHDPQVLVLDEPAAGLDPRARIELRELVRELARRGKTILISSHILSELAEICSVIGIIERGRMLVHGTIDEIRTRLKRGTVVRLATLDDVEEVRKRVMLLPKVGEVRPSGNELEFDFGGDDAERAELLRKLIESGVRVTQFASREQGLEDIFMQITTGEVQ